MNQLNMCLINLVISFLLAKPSQPVGPVKIKDIEPTSVTLEWQPPKDDGGAKISGYKVSMTTDQSIWTDVTITQKKTFTVTKLITNQSYYFRIVAFNDIGDSKPLESEEVVCKAPTSKY